MKKLPINFIFPVAKLQAGGLVARTNPQMQMQNARLDPLRGGQMMFQAAAMPIDSGAQAFFQARGQNMQQEQFDWQRKRAEIQDRMNNLKYIAAAAKDIGGLQVMPGRQEELMELTQKFRDPDALTSAVSDPEAMAQLMGEYTGVITQAMPWQREKELYDQKVARAQELSNTIATMPTDRLQFLDESIGQQLTDYQAAIEDFGMNPGPDALKRVNELEGPLNFLFDTDAVNKMVTQAEEDRNLQRQLTEQEIQSMKDRTRYNDAMIADVNRRGMALERDAELYKQLLTEHNGDHQAAREEFVQTVNLSSGGKQYSQDMADAIMLRNAWMEENPGMNPPPLGEFFDQVTDTDVNYRSFGLTDKTEATGNVPGFASPEGMVPNAEGGYSSMNTYYDEKFFNDDGGLSTTQFDKFRVSPDHTLIINSDYADAELNVPVAIRSEDLIKSTSGINQHYDLKGGGLWNYGHGLPDGVEDKLKNFTRGGFIPNDIEHPRAGGKYRTNSPAVIQQILLKQDPNAGWDSLMDAVKKSKHIKFVNDREDEAWFEVDVQTFVPYHSDFGNPQMVENRLAAAEEARIKAQQNKGGGGGDPTDPPELPPEGSEFKGPYDPTGTQTDSLPSYF